MGFKSGGYGGKKMNLAPAFSINSLSFSTYENLHCQLQRPCLLLNLALISDQRKVRKPLYYSVLQT